VFQVFVVNTPEEQLCSACHPIFIFNGLNNGGAPSQFTVSIVQKRQLTGQNLHNEHA
jgi:hypothetical protein